jgi:parallel beta-helix repeat protein
VRLWRWAWMSLAVGCGPHDADSCDEVACDTDASDADTDVDSDTDADADTDSDTGPDTDTDTNTDTDPPFVLSCDTAVEETGPCTVDADGDGTYLTIQEAVDAAAEGDVITVCPGVYDSVVIDRIGVTLIGYGTDTTCIIGTIRSGVVVEAVTVDISGFTISGNADDPGALMLRAATASIHDIRVAGVEGGGPFAIESAVLAERSEVSWDAVIWEYNGARALVLERGNYTIRHSIFAYNHSGLDGWWSTLEATNCVFIANDTGMELGSTHGTVANNIFYRNAYDGLSVVDTSDGHSVVRNNVALENGWGFSGAYWDIDFNIAWNNPLNDYNQGFRGSNDMIMDPMFVDAASGNFALQPSSPAVDAGDPDPTYDDADGSRNDVGIFGGPHGDWSPPPR